jgi:hypothetical protein
MAQATTTGTVFHVKQNDLAKPITVYLEYSDDTPADITGATVKFIMRREKTVATPKVNASATVVDATTGQVRYDWAEGDTDTPGRYDCEWQVTLPGGEPGTFPDKGYDTVVITAELGS